MKLFIGVLLLALSASAAGASERCVASVYTTHETWGSKTASGRPLVDSALTAAHRTKPFGSRVLITNVVNKRTATVVIIDRGPYKRGRCIDVTKAVAHALGFSGLAQVQVD